MEKVARIRRTCLCCGKEIFALECRIRRGRARFCSKQCSGRVNSVRHGGTNTRAHNSWAAMRGRCLNPNGVNYDRYGGRGVAICERWMTFENFLADMGAPPEGTSLDRIDTNQGYGPSNCRWATASEQLLNRRNTKRFMFRGEMRPLKTISDLTGISRYTLEYRYAQGWPEDALASPPKPRKDKGPSRPHVA